MFFHSRFLLKHSIKTFNVDVNCVLQKPNTELIIFSADCKSLAQRLTCSSRSWIVNVIKSPTANCFFIVRKMLLFLWNENRNFFPHFQFIASHDYIHVGASFRRIFNERFTVKLKYLLVEWKFVDNFEVRFVNFKLHLTFSFQFIQMRIKTDLKLLFGRRFYTTWILDDFCVESMEIFEADYAKDFFWYAVWKTFSYENLILIWAGFAISWRIL